MRSLFNMIAVAGVLMLVPAVYGGKPAVKNRKKGSSDRVKTERAARARLDPAAINNPLTIEPVGPKSRGSALVRAQILLDRARFSPGEIDGQYGDNLRIAVEGYQAAHKMTVSGTVDAATWQSLNADMQPALVPYTITQEDVSGPYEQIPNGMMEQAQLKSLGYQTEAEALGEHFHIKPELLAELNRGKDFAKAGEQMLVPNVVRAQAGVHAERVVVSKSKRTVTAEGAGGSVLAQYPATMGSEHDPLPIGEWKIANVQQNPVFHYNPDLFWNANPKDSKAEIPAGPNNPVGVVWMGLTKEHYGIHGTPQPGTIGHTESHGCIRLTNWDAEDLSHLIKTGTPAILEE